MRLIGLRSDCPAPRTTQAVSVRRSDSCSRRRRGDGSSSKGRAEIATSRRGSNLAVWVGMKPRSMVHALSSLQILLPCAALIAALAAPGCADTVDIIDGAGSTGTNGEGGAGGSVATSSTQVGDASSSSGSSEADDATVSTSASTTAATASSTSASSGGGVSPGQGISTGPNDFCVVAPWTDDPQPFVSSDGSTNIPAGTYSVRYVGGAQSHDAMDQYAGGCGEQPGDFPTCFEVTAHYDAFGIEAGHHIYNGANPYSADSTTSFWIDGITVGNLPTVAAVEQANVGHTWTLAHAGGPLFITYYDNDYGGNVGPGTQFCIDASP